MIGRLPYQCCRCLAGLLVMASCLFGRWSLAQDGGGPLPDDYSCMLCHRKDGDLYTDGTPIADEEHLAEDLHWKLGLQCHDCHGGSPSLSTFKNHRDDDTFRSSKTREASIALCGHCHSSIGFMRDFDPFARTDQVVEYWSSGHGTRLKASLAGDQPNEDKQVATCVSCHGKHGILPITDPQSPVFPANVSQTCAKCHSDPEVMNGRTYHDRPIGHEQFAQWSASVHGRALLEKGDLSAPTCNDCHGNHGSTPTGVDSVSNSCGQCHGKIAGLFAETRMKHAFEEVGLPGCATCHTAHSISPPTDQMLDVNQGGVCSKCHNPENPQYGATLVGNEAAVELRNRFQQLEAEFERVDASIHTAERLGMEVRGPHFDLRNAFESLTNARTLIHSFDPKPVNAELEAGFAVTAEVQAAADAAIRQHTSRRYWLAAFWVPIIIVIGLLLLVIRSTPIDTPAASQPSQ